ncbi:MAG: ABC transporter ATP-binding protein [Bdellovibrionales bacterium]|jgi:putative ABC transport system ATP-binding protein|nr:ABC transporter ATP-binding protein [Bdellovibrionales bacterium]
MMENHEQIVLKVESLVKSYALPSTGDAGSGEGRLQVLRGLSFEVRAKDRLAIMGKSGGGKSTLLGCLAGLDQPDSGSVHVLGRNLSMMNASELNAFRASSIGIVFQQFQLLDHFTALENVRLPLDLAGIDGREADRIAREKLERVGLLERSHHFPEQMSRGECQRVAIARVLATGSRLIFADEPTGSLDAKTGRLVMDLLFELADEAGAALVLVTHDPALAQRCDRILRLEDGRLIEASTMIEGRA